MVEDEVVEGKDLNQRSENVTSHEKAILVVKSMGTWSRLVWKAFQVLCIKNKICLNNSKKRTNLCKDQWDRKYIGKISSLEKFFLITTLF